jgi:hypothetical protein
MGLAWSANRHQIRNRIFVACRPAQCESRYACPLKLKLFAGMWCGHPELSTARYRLLLRREDQAVAGRLLGSTVAEPSESLLRAAALLLDQKGTFSRHLLPFRSH